MKDIQGGLLVGKEAMMFVSIVGIEVQIGMTLDVAKEEVIGPGRVEMVISVSRIKVMLNGTNVVNLVTTTMSFLNRRNKRQIYLKRNHTTLNEWYDQTDRFLIGTFHY